MSLAPEDWITNWAVVGTDIVVPIASLTGLDAADAHGTTGDIRECLYRILETVQTKIDALDSAARPQKMTNRRTSSMRDADGTEIITRNFSTRFELLVASMDVEVEDEPA